MRCSQRKIACSYPSRPARSEAASIDPSPATPAALVSDFVLDGVEADETPIDFVVPSCSSEPVDDLWNSRQFPCLRQLELPWTPAEAPGQSIEAADAISLGLAVDERYILGDGNVDSNFFFDITGSMSTGKDIAERPSLAVHAAPTRLNLAGLHAALETNFSYAMDRIRAAPSTMLQENQTPWSHPLLYRDNMPREMQGMDHQSLRLLLRNTRFGRDTVYCPHNYIAN